MLDKILDSVRKECNIPIFFSYRKIVLSKRKGGKRILAIPSVPLRKSQKSLLQFFTQFKTHHAAHGFVDGKSIITHARLHIAKESILTVDIEDFFGSITSSHLEKLFRFNGVQSQTDIDLLKKLTTLDSKLPQGAPTSPVLSNAVAYEMDCELENWAKQKNLIYSRYADDMVFSSENRTIEIEFINEVSEIVLKHGFKLNHSKTRILPRGRRQIVTGLVVNTKLNVKREYLRNTSAILHNILSDPFSALNQISRGTIFRTYQNYAMEYLTRKMSIIEFERLTENQSSEKKLINPTRIRLKKNKYPYQHKSLFRLLLLLQAVKGRISFISSVIGEDSNRVQKLRKQFQEIEKVLFRNVTLNWSEDTIKLYNKVQKECPQIIKLILE